MKRSIFTIMVVAFCVVVRGTALAGTIASTDFDSAATTNDTTAAALDAVTSGGTWALGSGANVHQEIHDDAGPGTKALFSGSHVEGETCTGPGATLTLDVPVAVSGLTEDLVFSFKTGTSVKTGFNINAYWYILDDVGGTLAEIKLDDGGIYLTGDGNFSLMAQDQVVGTSWDSSDNEAITMTITIDSTGDVVVYAEDGDSSGSLTNNIGTGDTVASLRTSWEPSKGQGVYLADVLVTGPTALAVALDGADSGTATPSVRTNAPPGASVGIVSMLYTNSGDMVYSLQSGGDNDSFEITTTSTTNLRTSAWLAKSSYSVTVVATNSSDGFWTNGTFSITVDEADMAFVVNAEVTGAVSDGDTVGTAQAKAGRGTLGSYSIIGGREDLFSWSGSELQIANESDWGGVGTTNYVTIQAVDSGSTNSLIVAVGVVSAPSSGSLFLFW